MALQDKLLGSPVILLGQDSASIDTVSLCGSKHEAWVWVTDEDESGSPNALQDSIIVGFKGLDSSGAGCIDAITEGALTYITDFKQWSDTVQEGYQVLKDRADNCQGAWDCTKDYTKLGVYSSAAGLTTAAGTIGSGVASTTKKGWKKVKGWFSAESFSADTIQNCTDNFGGTLFHNQSGSEHKVKIIVNKLYQGVTTKVHEVELAGSSEYKKVDNKLWFEPAYKKLKLTGPGMYTIQIKSLAANQECGTPDLDFTTTVEVLPDTSVTEDTSGDAVGSLVASTGVRPLYVYGGIILFGGLLLSKLYSPRK